MIINSPFEEPKSHWHYDRQSRTFDQRDGRRPAGYVVATPDSQSFDDPSIFIDLPLVNQIRSRVKTWRENYPGVTGITKRLLEHWHDREQRQYPLFFCQLEAIETLIWLTEAPAAEKTGIDIPKDGDFTRLCSKMATGSGKTVVMAMLIAWQVLNKVTYPHDPRFSKYIVAIAPGLTVKERLKVLEPFGAGNYYDEFGLVPAGLIEKLRQGKVLIHNWHKLSWETEEQVAKKRSWPILARNSFSFAENCPAPLFLEHPLVPSFSSALQHCKQVTIHYQENYMLYGNTGQTGLPYNFWFLHLCMVTQVYASVA